MDRRITALAAVWLLNQIWCASAQSADLKLNYIDPEGVGLALTLLREPASLSWLDKAITLQANKGHERSVSSPCRALRHQSMPCTMSEETASIMATLSQHNAAADLEALLASKELVRDEDAPKSVLVGTVAVVGDVKHIDFVGLIRGKYEVLSAPDAVSVFVVRFSPDGKISIVERTPDATVDVNQIKFSSEK
jgi:hypothetical protein